MRTERRVRVAASTWLDASHRFPPHSTFPAPENALPDRPRAGPPPLPAPSTEGESLPQRAQARMARVVEGNAQTGTWARPATPQMEKVGGQWVSKGWNELEYKGWVFKAMSRPPSDEGRRVEVKRALGLEGGVPVPENVFGESVLECSHPGHGVRFEFRAEDALAGWHANQQKRLGRTVSKSEFDWTFSTPYNGSIHLDKAVLREKLRAARRIEAPEYGVPMKTRTQIPMGLLEKRGHIHFYDHIELFTDPLQGKGHSEASVKIRAMEECFLVLFRSFICLNNQSVYMRDVRYYHEFDTSVVLRDEQVREASWQELHDAVARTRPMSASVREDAKEDPRYYANPEQVYEALAPKHTLNEMISLNL